jgi:Tetratricopeptide repeat
MDPAEATELFISSAKLKNLNQEVEAEANLIVKELDCLALAITLTGSYVAAIPRLSSDLRRRLPGYRAQRKKQLSRKPTRNIHQYRESVLTTCESSFDAIMAVSPLVSRLLCFLAFLNFDDIFLGLLGLDSDDSNLPAQEPIPKMRLRPHLMATFNIFWRVYISLHLQEVETLDVVDKIGAFLSGTGQWSDDVDIRRFLSERLANLLEMEHPDTLNSMKNLAAVLNKQGRHEEAGLLDRQTLKLREKPSGNQHSNTLMSMNNLAAGLTIQGKYEETEKLHRETMGLARTVL